MTLAAAICDPIPPFVLLSFPRSQRQRILAPALVGDVAPPPHGTGACAGGRLGGCDVERAEGPLAGGVAPEFGSMTVTDLELLSAFLLPVLQENVQGNERVGLRTRCSRLCARLLAGLDTGRVPCVSVIKPSKHNGRRYWRASELRTREQPSSCERFT